MSAQKSMGTKGELYFPLNSEVRDPLQGTTYILKRIIGRGAYAQCFLAMVDNEPFALKIIRLADLKSEKVKQKLQSEISIHSSLDHPNIVKMYTHFKNSEYFFMVLELCERGGLDDLLRRNGRLKERYVSKFISQIVKGLIYLHDEMSVVHRDLKLGNLFLDNQLNIKIGDFGLSALIQGTEKRRTVCGTPNYIAPEILFGKHTGHSFEADIWSLGVIMYTLLIGTPPFQQKKVEEIYKLIELNKYIFPPDNNLSSEAIELITKLLTTNPNERPTLSEILSHKFLNQKENLAYRVYKNLFNMNFIIQPIQHDYVIFSMPMGSISGIGYVLKSGICGIYYQNLTNVYLKTNSLVYIKLKVENDRKVFVTEEHLLSNIPESLQINYSNIMYFIKTYVSSNYSISKAMNTEQRISQNGFRNEENKHNTLKSTGGNTISQKALQNAFVAKIKKIKDGLLFIMTNNIFVFDFNDGRRVTIANDGMNVYAFNDEDGVDFSQDLREACISILRMYTNNSK